MKTNKRKKISQVASFAVAAIILLAAGQSYAACTQSDLTGTWYLNGVTGDTWFGDFWETDFCKVRVNSNGKVVGSSSQCVYRDGLGKDTLNIVGGELLINASCKITGKIRYDLGGGLRTNFIVDDARMDNGKSVITVAGRVAIDPTIVSHFTGIKR